VSLRIAWEKSQKAVPRRWNDSRTGSPGYATACRNQWILGACENARIKCGSRPNQAFVPIAEDVARSHLQGRDIAAGRRSDSRQASIRSMWPASSAGLGARLLQFSASTTDAAGFSPPHSCIAGDDRPRQSCRKSLTALDRALASGRTSALIIRDLA
jgi:hypothetical protein